MEGLGFRAQSVGLLIPQSSDIYIESTDAVFRVNPKPINPKPIDPNPINPKPINPKP